MITRLVVIITTSGAIVMHVYCFRSSPPEVFLQKGVLKICSKFTGEHPCQSAISTKLLCNFIKIALWHGCSPANLLHLFCRIPFPKNTWRAAPVVCLHQNLKIDWKNLSKKSLNNVKSKIKFGLYWVKFLFPNSV